MFVNLCISVFFFVLFVPAVECAVPSKKALIFGVTGQDGTYLTQLLLSKNYEVHGVSRNDTGNLPSHHYFQHLVNSDSFFYFHAGNITDYSTVLRLIQTIQPDEIYNLAAQSSVKDSFEKPIETFDINGSGTLCILEAIRLSGNEKARYFQAASSELFGRTNISPQTEETPFSPCSPYGIAKLCSFWATRTYREAYGIFACNGILFNHESPLRGESFVTRKITLAASRYRLGLQEVLFMGNLDVKRDWGYAKDYVEAMWLMLQQNTADDYVIASGESHSVREFIENAFEVLDINIDWVGKGIDEMGIDRSTGKVVIRIDPQYYRPLDINYIRGQPLKAEKKLNWKPKTNFKELLKIMVEADYNKIRKLQPSPAVQDSLQIR